MQCATAAVSPGSALYRLDPRWPSLTVTFQDFVAEFEAHVQLAQDRRISGPGCPDALEAGVTESALSHRREHRCPVL
jgi:hypothetical protein